MDYIKLNNGVEMPQLGYGVYQVEPDIAERCVADALETGYRLIDTAQAYANEEGVGAAIAKSGIPRDEVFVTSKIWVSNANYERAAKSIDESIEKIGGGYIDLMLLHQAYGDYHGAYRAMEDAYKAGKLRAIGVSNFYPTRLIDLCAFTEVKPTIDQIETHPFRQQRAAHENMEHLGVQHEAWAPFAEGANGIFSNPVLTEIGKVHGKSAGQVVLRALMQQGVVVIPKSTHKERMAENIDVFDFELSDEEMAQFDELEDPSFPRIFDHASTQTVDWLLNEYVKKQQLDGGTLY